MGRTMKDTRLDVAGLLAHGSLRGTTPLYLTPASAWSRALSWSPISRQSSGCGRTLLWSSRRKWARVDGSSPPR